jgi:hypothetical protein
MLIISVLVISGCCLSSSVGATGILPPSNPPNNIAPSSSDFVTSINSARAQEGVGPMNLSAAEMSGLPVPEQVFILVNEERIDRGLPPMEYMTSQLNADAQLGADQGEDPGFPTTLTVGAPIAWGGAIWAGGVSTALEADYYWMYSDGYGGHPSSTTNSSCGSLTPSECWGHRDIILHTFPSCPSGAPTLSMGAAYSTTGYSGGSIGAVLVSTCGGPPSDVTLTWTEVQDGALATPDVVGLAAPPNDTGYWEAKSDGTVTAFGGAASYGSLVSQTVSSPIVGISPTPNGAGYWLVAADGQVSTFGDAKFYGSTAGLHLVAPIVGMAPTPNGAGYWLVAADGGVFTFGDAPFRGSMGGHRLNLPVVGIASDSATDGYWLVAADGGIFSFHAPFFGSTGSLHLVKPINGMEALANGQGYRFGASDGGVFCFGQAKFEGSMGGKSLVDPVVGMAADLNNFRYRLVTADGSISSFGNAS